MPEPILPPPQASTPLLHVCEQALRAYLEELPSVLIAYSGGVDSALLMHAAHDVLGPDRARAVLADSPSLPRRELHEAVALATDRGWALDLVQTGEMDNPDYAANPINRCYFCKAELFTQLEAYARKHRYHALAYGENADDAGDFRPGQQAATEFKVLAPLRETGLTKAIVRALSEKAGLPTASKPALPCLASRLPTGQPVTVAALAQVEQAEDLLRQRGYRIIRVRHHGDHARVQVGPDEVVRLTTEWDKIQPQLLAIGYTSATFDSDGYRGASLR